MGNFSNTVYRDTSDSLVQGIQNRLNNTYYNFSDKKPTTVKSEELEPVFVDKIIPLLQEYFYGDYEKIQLILGDGFIRETKNSVPFAVKKPYDDIPEHTFSIVEKPNMEEALRKLLNI